MTRLLLVDCPGLTFALATRGDSTLHIPDLIADGGIAPMIPGPLPGIPEDLESNVEFRTLPDLLEKGREALSELDGKLGELREGFEGEMIVIASRGTPESPASEEDHAAFLSSVPMDALEPGKVLRPEGAASLIRALLAS